MGRAERRKQERLDRLNSTTSKHDVVRKRYTQEEFDKLIQQVDYQARLETVQMMMTAFALAEHRIHKFGHTRVKRTIDYVEQLMDDINHDKASFEQYREDCLKEIGINFVL